MRSELSPRQLQVLRLLAGGLTDDEIAEVLNVSRTTEQRHLNELRWKLDARNRTHAVAIGYRRGLLT